MGSRCRRTRGRTTSTRTLRCGPLAAAVLLLRAGSVGAAPISFSLTWDAPAECPDSKYLRAEVETLLAGAPPTLVGVTARAEVHHRDDGSWTVRLRTDREGTVGERSLEADSCRSLADATALVVALTIDPAHVASAAEPPSAPAPATTSASAPAPSPSASPPLPSPAPSEVPRRADVAHLPTGAPNATGATGARGSRPRWAVFPAIAGDLGTLPHLAYGFSLSGSVMVGRFRGELYGAFWPNQTAHGQGTIPQADGGTVELVDGGMRACAPTPDQSLPLQRIELSPCAGLEAGGLRGKGVNLAPALTRTSLWLAVTLDARAVVRLSRSWGIGLDVEAVVPLRRDVFTFGAGPSAPTIHEAGIIEGRAWMGPELRF